ncbi:short-chain dehydrogenase [Talaromyces pinophilus]|jgi:NAD(P)-dependent dehydrogenase (short-subunit alcohol dehydrogenase family)|uniref:Short-chain dehydrogenase n=1 Tax=Talaromyces pinophilus TaxID=128442 RepID=A0A0B8MYH4_TALPI|nr:putative oxidoreductase YusZ [Talaromyces pinophilus]GAM40288.1 short-chain dehydrogenase [Talaromyces pinophilus]
MDQPSPVWCITGASSGFGREIALSALQRGHRVIATARDTSKISDLEQKGSYVLALDVSDSIEKLTEFASTAMQVYQRVDYLINAAGYILEGAVEEATPEEVQRQFAVNVFGTTNLIRAFLPHLRAQSVLSEIGKQIHIQGRHRATIAVFGSLGSWVGGASYAFYAMTKSCMSSLAESLKEELAPFDIQATVIEPGYFRTGFLNPGSKVSTATRIPAYEDETTPSGSVRKGLEAHNGHQLGDVKKGASLCVDILTSSGIAEGRDLPLRIVLGSDCVDAIRNKCTSTLNLIESWAAISVQSDHA